MLIIKNEDFEQLSVFDQMLLKSCLETKGELAVVDKIVDDGSLFAPFIEKFNSRCGRHSTPVDTYIPNEVLKENTSIPERIVSIFDQEARPIKRGKAKAEIEFGRKVALAESEEGLIISSRVEEGNPCDKTLAVPMVKKSIEVLNKAPEEVAADRGFYSSENEREIQGLNVEHVAIPKPGKKSEKRLKYERQHWFKRLIRWRAGGEATIGLLKRKYGFDVCLFHSENTGIWVNLSIFSYNVTKLAKLMVQIC